MKRLLLAALTAIVTMPLVCQRTPVSQGGSPQEVMQSSESARLVEEFDGYTLGRLSLHFPKGTIKVQGVEVIDKDILFRATFSTNQGEAIFYQDQLRTTELLRGRIRSLHAETLLAIPGTSQRTLLRIHPSRFVLEVQAITASVPTGISGNLNVRNRFLRLTNVDEVVDVQDSFTGHLALTLTDATMDRIRFNFTGTKDSLTVAASLSLPKQSEWLIDLATSRILWESGRIKARNVRVEASENSVINIGGVKAEFRKLGIKDLEVTKERKLTSVIVYLHGMELDVGSVEIKHDIAIKGALKRPMTFEGWWWGALSDDGQIAASYYDFSHITAGLQLSHFEDATGFAIDNSDIDLEMTHFCVEELTGSIAIQGGDVTLAGSATGKASLKSLSLAVSGPTGRLSGSGKISLNSFRITTEVQTPVVDRCSETMPLKLTDAEGLAVDGAVLLTDGRTGIDLTMDDFSTRASLGYYRCEWDQKIGDLGRWEVCADSWCPTWAEPFRTCRQCVVIWDGGPVYVHWVLEKQPSIVDQAVAIRSLRVRIDPKIDNGKLKLCGGRLKFLSPSPQWFSLGPNVRASGTVADLFRDAVKLWYGFLESSITQPTRRWRRHWGHLE